MEGWEVVGAGGDGSRFGGGGIEGVVDVVGDGSDLGCSPGWLGKPTLTRGTPSSPGPKAAAGFGSWRRWNSIGLWTPRLAWARSGTKSLSQPDEASCSAEQRSDRARNVVADERFMVFFHPKGGRLPCSPCRRGRRG